MEGENENHQKKMRVDIKKEVGHLLRMTMRVVYQPNTVKMQGETRAQLGVDGNIDVL